MRVKRFAPAVAAAIAVVAVAVSWFSGLPDLTASEAEAVAVDALRAAGVDAEVAGAVEPGTHTTDDGIAREAWFVALDAALGSETTRIEVAVQADAGQILRVDDRTDAGDLALSDAQFAAVDEFRDDVNQGRWLRRNAAGTVAALVVVAMALALVRADGAAGERPGRLRASNLVVTPAAGEA